MSDLNLSILIAGDIIPVAGKDEDKSCDALKRVHQHFSEADLAVCHLGLPAGWDEAVTAEQAQSFAEAGIRVVAAADNHSYVLDHPKICKAKPILEAAGLRVAGVRETSDDKAYAMAVVKGVRVAVLNYGYAPPGKRLPAQNDATASFVNFFRFKKMEENLASIQKEIETARQDGAEVVILYLHWGDNCESYSSISEKYVAHRCAMMGVDAIVGSHCQVLQEMETLCVKVGEREKHVPVFYGLGSMDLGAEEDKRTDAVLAKLNISLFDGEVSVAAEYIPLPGNSEQAEASKSQEIEPILQNHVRPMPVVTHFDDILKLAVGQKKSLGLDGCAACFSEDAVVVSALQNGELLGNNVGYTAIAAADEDGNLHGMMVNVSGVHEQGIPILVNENNAIRGYYSPRHLIKGAEFGLPDNIYLCRTAAESWMVMRESAWADGVVLSVRAGHRNLRQQRMRVRNLGNAYPQAGKSEHHLGLSLHIQGGERDGITTTPKQAKEWVLKYAHHFGFLAREPKNKQVYIHVRYLERLGEARYLHNNGLTLEAYLEAYDEHNKRRLSAEQKAIEIPMDGVAVLQSLVPGCILRSENAYVASVLQTGKVIGNTTGKTEVTISVGQKVLRKISCVVYPKLPVLLNRYNKVPCSVEKLVRLPMNCTFGERIIYLEEKTAKAFEIMCEVARTQGIWLYAKQGYRSQDDQRRLIQYYTEKDGAEAAALRCAPPGYSEHHSGLAIDVNGGVYKDGKKVKDSPSAWAWVHDHCYEFGFFLKNLPGKEHITGTRAEPWHVRYLGDLDVCRVLFERQITLDEYLDEML